MKKGGVKNHTHLWPQVVALKRFELLLDTFMGHLYGAWLSKPVRVSKLEVSMCPMDIGSGFSNALSLLYGAHACWLWFLFIIADLSTSVSSLTVFSSSCPQATPQKFAI